MAPRTKTLVVFGSCSLGTNTGSEHVLFDQSKEDLHLFVARDNPIFMGSWMWTGNEADEAELVCEISQEVAPAFQQKPLLTWVAVSIVGLPPGRHNIPMGASMTLTANVEVASDWEEFGSKKIYKHFWHLDPISLRVNEALLAELV